jgi:hypothetical protein
MTFESESRDIDEIIKLDIDIDIDINFRIIKYTTPYIKLTTIKYTTPDGKTIERTYNSDEYSDNDIDEAKTILRQDGNIIISKNLLTKNLLIRMNIIKYQINIFIQHIKIKWICTKKNMFGARKY